MLNDLDEGQQIHNCPLLFYEDILASGLQTKV
jgi:hypothetical protein